MPPSTTIETTDLEELIDILRTCGVSVRSPHQRMIDEAEAAAAGEAAEVAAAAEAAEIAAAAAEAEAKLALAEAQAKAAAAEAAAAEAAAAEAAAAEAEAEARAKAAEAVTLQGGLRPEPAQASRPDPRTREAVVQALATLGVEVSSAAAPPSPPAPVGTSQSVGGGGIAAMTSIGAQSASQVPTKFENAPSGPLPGSRCSKCGHWNAPAATTASPDSVSPPKAWYVVTVGLDVGIFTAWHVASPLVNGVSGAVFKKYNSRELAEAKYNEALREGRVRRVAP